MSVTSIAVRNGFVLAKLNDHVFGCRAVDLCLTYAKSLQERMTSRIYHSPHISNQLFLGKIGLTRKESQGNRTCTSELASRIAFADFTNSRRGPPTRRDHNRNSAHGHGPPPRKKGADNIDGMWIVQTSIGVKASGEHIPFVVEGFSTLE
ncbi:hypothetical protein JAAARDRAFT_478229 [Jaapia argillacea MUCL 33604]|uniref:Uncharacterized protein n=1 Tax=Jaapia argillacea MUCL 33604 TaxID=933084 RepID=A0A067PC83_9AGAM|nr:hypothetical protein JAAARDRAFT_478229 [Jaapia argillacea MUCL 33604]